MDFKTLVKGPHRCKPKLFEVEEDEIRACQARFDIHPSLVSFWRVVGYGFFVFGDADERLTTFANRLMHPIEIPDLFDANAFEDENPFELGFPFFETADGYYMVLKDDGSIHYQEGGLIADSLEQFIASILDDPEFYVSKLA